VIESVALSSASGEPIVLAKGGEDVRLRMRIRTQAAIARPIFGFYIKDRLGQLVLGDNSDRVRPAALAPGTTCSAEFAFQLPHLSAGDYVVTAALADGDQDAHRMLHWIHEALVFRSNSLVMHGLIGVPTRIAVHPSH
jgi:lipopolysaccharide transport system ATP-binding protein